MKKFVIVVSVLVVILIGVAYYLGWFNPTKHSSADDKKITLSVEVDKEKIKEDTAAAQEKAKEIGEKIKDRTDKLGKEETTTGKIARIETVDNRIVVVTDDNKEVTIHADASTAVRLSGAAKELKDLRSGDRVTVVHTAKDGKSVARSITADRS